MHSCGNVPFDCNLLLSLLVSLVMEVNPELTWKHPEPLLVLNLQFRFSVSGRASDERIHDSLLEQAADGPHLLLRVPASCLGPGKEFLSYKGLVTDFLCLLSIFLEDFVSAIPHLGTFQNKQVRAEKDTEQDFKIIKPHILVNSPIRHSPNFFCSPLVLVVSFRDAQPQIFFCSN